MATSRAHATDRPVELNGIRGRLEEALPGVLITLFAALVAVVGWLGIQVFEQGKALSRIEGKIDALSDTIHRH